MKRLMLTTAIAFLTLGAPVFAAATIASVDVTIDLPAVTNTAAAQRFNHIADDLKNAIAALLVDRLSEDGAKITVDISAVELSNSYTESAGIADTKLVGLVHILDDKQHKLFDNYTLTIDVNQAKTFLAPTIDMTTLKASSDEYYKAMIQAFANAVVDKLKA